MLDCKPQCHCVAELPRVSSFHLCKISVSDVCVFAFKYVQIDEFDKTPSNPLCKRADNRY